ncbi:hypothetical protein BFS06_12355 [Clostridium perfringens]|uniref:Uncharacterized protein n=1 Tax=Clostridium perfringens TaxID=1502 RepID=A0A140GR38_CLOPF|nr:hypothetical protein [Clostridium perfringens]AMN30997.1 hypothetical protein JFP838_pA0081 [Clostridium perfringens]TBX14993.1 hypothetical protein BFS06_12355 [Clostridium perfringens]
MNLKVELTREHLKVINELLDEKLNTDEKSEILLNLKEIFKVPISNEDIVQYYLKNNPYYDKNDYLLDNTINKDVLLNNLEMLLKYNKGDKYVEFREFIILHDKLIESDFYNCKDNKEDITSNNEKFVKELSSLDIKYTLVLEDGLDGLYSFLIKVDKLLDDEYMNNFSNIISTYKESFKPYLD